MKKLIITIALLLIPSLCLADGWKSKTIIKGNNGTSYQDISVDASTNALNTAEWYEHTPKN